MIGRLLITASLVALVVAPCDGRDRHERRSSYRRDNSYTREVRFRQIERRITENRRLRDRQDRYGAGRRDRDYDDDRVMDFVGEDE